MRSLAASAHPSKVERQSLPAVGATIVIPVYNEAGLLEPVVERCLAAAASLPLSWHLCIVDDGSDDWNDEFAQRWEADDRVTVIRFSPNAGKGAVLNRLFPLLASDYTVVIDADGEYAPEEIERLLLPLHRGEADWVLGSRYGFERPRPPQYWATYLANQLLAGWFNALSRIGLRDPLTGLYAFRSSQVREMQLREGRFAYTAELLWRAHLSGETRWKEVPVSYRFRTYEQGKKIRWWELGTLMSAFWRYRRG